jgi:hypothetical protein
MGALLDGITGSSVSLDLSDRISRGGAEARRKDHLVLCVSASLRAPFKDDNPAPSLLGVVEHVKEYLQIQRVRSPAEAQRRGDSIIDLSLRLRVSAGNPQGRQYCSVVSGIGRTCPRVSADSKGGISRRGAEARRFDHRSSSASPRLCGWYSLEDDNLAPSLLRGRSRFQSASMNINGTGKLPCHSIDPLITSQFSMTGCACPCGTWRRSAGSRRTRR